MPAPGVCLPSVSDLSERIGACRDEIVLGWDIGERSASAVSAFRRSAPGWSELGSAYF